MPNAQYLLGAGAIGQALLGELLLRFAFRPLSLLLGLLHTLLLLGQDNLDVARARHIGVDATVRTVCPAPSVASLVHLSHRTFSHVRICTIGPSYSTRHDHYMQMCSLCWQSSAVACIGEKQIPECE